MIRQLLAATACAGLAAGAGHAQEWNQFHGPYVIGEIGYENGGGGFDQFIGGGAVGANFRLNEDFFVGGDFEFLGSADGDIDFTWGIHGQVGYVVQERHAVFVRAGYREFNFDFDIGNEGDFSLGAGTQFELSDNWSVRTLVDTIDFDTIGVRGGLVFHF